MKRLIDWLFRKIANACGWPRDAVEQRMADTFLYFAYGSNMLTLRLRGRTSSAEANGIGYVAGRRLTFNKTSDDGSGKGDARLTNDAADRVEGVLFRIDTAQKQALDDAEGVGHGYEESFVDVITAKGTVRALAYVASAGATDPARRPYHWYKRLVLGGAIEHGLSPGTIATIRAVPSIDDPLPNRRRKREAEAVLAESGIIVD